MRFAALCMIGISGSLPVYWLACDFGRWLCLSIMLVLLLASSPKLAILVNECRFSAIFPLRHLRVWFGILGSKLCQTLLLVLTPLLFLAHYSKPPMLLYFSLRYIDKSRNLLELLARYLLHLLEVHVHL